MAIIPAILDAHLDDARQVVIITVVVNNGPPPPPNTQDQVYSQPSGTRYSFEARATKLDTAPPTVTRTTITPQGPQWHVLTWNGTAYANPTRINEDGTPYTG